MVSCWSGLVVFSVLQNLGLWCLLVSRFFPKRQTLFFLLETHTSHTNDLIFLSIVLMLERPLFSESVDNFSAPISLGLLILTSYLRFSQCQNHQRHPLLVSLMPIYLQQIQCWKLLIECGTGFRSPGFPRLHFLPIKSVLTSISCLIGLHPHLLIC